MSAPAPTLLETLQASAAASSAGAMGPANVLAQAPPDTPPNALTEQLANLNLPYGEQLFAPIPDSTAIPVSSLFGGAPATLTPAPFSIFGLGTTASVILVGLGAFMLLGQGHRRGRGA